MKIVFSPGAKSDFDHFKKNDPKNVDRIKKLIQNILQTPHSGLGKPEALKHALSGYWSRRIDREHRLVYKVESDTLYIASCRYHYR